MRNSAIRSKLGCCTAKLRWRRLGASGRRCDGVAGDSRSQLAPWHAVDPAARRSKDLYEIGEIPPLGHVPSKMYAWAIRRERHGAPETSMQVEVVPTWQLDSHDVLVLVMAAGVNYNGVWAGARHADLAVRRAQGPYPHRRLRRLGHRLGGGRQGERWKVGDEVVIHCNQDDGDDEECNGGDPMFSPSQRIWGYETPDGSFAQFSRVQSGS